MRRLLIALLVTTMIVGLGFENTFAGDNMPSSKAAAAINPVISLRADSTADAWDNDTDKDSVGWKTILNTAIKTANNKELAFDVALQCGLITDTTVRSKGGAKDGAEAEGKIRVRVKIKHPDGSVTYAEPAKEYRDPFDGKKKTQNGITYCDRFQKLEANFAGLNCWAAAYGVEGYCDPDSSTCTAGDVGADCEENSDCDVEGGDEVAGVCREDGICTAGKVGEECTTNSDCDLTLAAGEVYCEDPEELRLILKTLNAHSFNFLAIDVPPGVQSIKVQAKAQTNAALSGTKFGEASSTALVGAGSMLVESVRMVKSADEDIITLE